MNCSLLYILQANGYNSNIFVILLSSSLQILIVSAFGQQLQNEATAFRNTLYTIDWPRMSIESRKRILLLMSGSSRVVTVRAGGAYELNLALFAQVSGRISSVETQLTALKPEYLYMYDIVLGYESWSVTLRCHASDVRNHAI